MEEERKIYLPYLLSALWQAGFEGAVTLLEGDVQRIVMFHAGRPTNVQSRLQEETLGRILLEEGSLSQEEYSTMLSTMVKTRQRAGEILVGMGILGHQEVYLALEFQARKKMLNCFKMVDFGFILEKKPVSPDNQIIRINPAEAIFSGIQTCYSVDRLLTEFPVNEDTVFKARPSPKNLSIRMGPRESKVLRSIGSNSTLASLSGKEEDLRQLLSSLYAMHALALVDASRITRPSTTDLDLPELTTEVPLKVTEAEEVGEEPRPTTLTKALKSKGLDDELTRKVLSLGAVDHFEVLEIDRSVQGQALKNAFQQVLHAYKLDDIDSAYHTRKERKLAARLLDRIAIAYRELDDVESRKAYLKALDQEKSLEKRKVPPRVLADVEAQKGELAIGARRYQEAARFYEKAIKLYPQEPSYHFQLGVAQYMGVVDETPPDQPLPDWARKPFLKAIAMNPRYDMPRLYLGYISKRNKDFKRALKEVEGALECNPANQRAHSEVRFLKRRLEKD